MEKNALSDKYQKFAHHLAEMNKLGYIDDQTASAYNILKEALAHSCEHPRIFLQLVAKEGG